MGRNKFNPDKIDQELSQCVIKPKFRNAYLHTTDSIITEFNNMLLWKRKWGKGLRPTPFVVVNNLWKCVRFDNSILTDPELSKVIKDVINKYGEI